MKRNNSIKFNRTQKQLRKRILEISFENRLSHLGSCLTAIDLIEEIYKLKKAKDVFVLSNGHAGIAQYVVLEKHGVIKDSSVINTLHIHPDRNLKLGIHVSTGSLGQGLPIALGMALADKSRKVYCMVSDGEAAEGSIWESFRVISEKKVTNLVTIINANGWSAYDRVNLILLQKRCKAFGFEVRIVNGHNPKEINASLKKTIGKKPVLIFARTIVEQFPFLKGQDAHYYFMQEEDYLQAIEQLL